VKKQKLVLFFNPGSGDGSSNPSLLLEQVTRKLVDLGFKVDVVMAHSKKKLTKTARQIAKKGKRLAVVMGGDGTIEAVAQGLIGSKTRLGILPNGTFNNIVKSLGIPENLEDACALLKSGSQRRVDMGFVKIGKEKQFFVERVAAGLSAAIYPEIKDVHSLDMNKITEAVKTFISYKIPLFSVRMGGKNQVEVETLLATVANTPVYGNTFMEAPGASLDDGLFDICLYPNFSKADLVAYFAAIRDGNVVKDDRVQRYRAKKVVIRSDPPQDVIVDNRVMGQGEIKMRILPKALRVIAPKEGGLASFTSPEAQKIPTPAPARVSETREQPTPEANKNVTKMQ
jgi:diacylglycerol kinase (ATP)